MGKRKNAHGAGTWAPPGGHLEYGETPEVCAQRETLEETGLVLTKSKSFTFTNDIFEKENKHYITLFILSKYEGGTPEVKEPEKCEEWKWFDLNQLPENVFLSIKNFKKLNFTKEKLIRELSTL